MVQTEYCRHWCGTRYMQNGVGGQDAQERQDMKELTYVPYCNCKRATARYMKRTGQYKCNKCGCLVDDAKSLMPLIPTDMDDYPELTEQQQADSIRFSREYEAHRELEMTGEL